MNAWMPLRRSRWRLDGRPWLRYGLTVGRFAFWGPLLGGLPYNVLLVPIPFSFIFGLAPATLAGMGFAWWWWRVPRPAAPGWRRRAACGAGFGLLGCALAAVLYWLGLNTGRSVGDLGLMVGLLSLHGVPAAALLGALKHPLPPAQKA